MKTKVFFAILIFATLSANVMLVYAEPTLDEIMDTLGFINRTPTPIDQETFQPGNYEITLYAEFAGYHPQNNLSWHVVGTSDYVSIFTGPEGNSGYVDPPITKSFKSTSFVQFGLSLWSPDGGGVRWFTETSLNPDGEKHALVYQSLDDPNLFFIGFENLDGGQSDWDYNDMVVSLQRLPEPVGGLWTPIDRFELLAPYLGMSGIVSTLFVMALYVKRKKKR